MPDGEPGELYSCNPYTFDGYWNLPEKTAEAFRGEYCTVGDMARRDADGFIHLVDRKSNMIISGGENIYPSEVEAVLGGHPAVRTWRSSACPTPKWGERVHAVVVLRDGACADRGRAARMVPRPHRRLQAAALLLVLRDDGHAAHRHRQDPAPRPQDPAHRGRGRAATHDRRRDRPELSDELSLRRLDRALPRRRAASTASSASRAATSSRSGTISARQGIRIVDVRHEGAAVHMAHAHAELTGKLGVAMVTAGPGVTNTVTAHGQRRRSRAMPVLLIGGCTSRPQANMGPLQDIPHVDILRPVTATPAPPASPSR